MRLIQELFAHSQISLTMDTSLPWLPCCFAIMPTRSTPHSTGQKRGSATTVGVGVGVEAEDGRGNFPRPSSHSPYFREVLW